LQVGGLLTATLLGAALLTLCFIFITKSLGYRRSLMLATILGLLSGLIFVFSRNYYFLILAALTGAFRPATGAVGPFEAVEQAILPQIASDVNRNQLFGWYNSVGAVASALGSLASIMPVWLQNWFGMDLLLGYQLFFSFLVLLNLINLLCYAHLSLQVEEAQSSASRTPRSQPQNRSRDVILGLTVLFGVDALAGGFVNETLIVLWFQGRFGLGLDVLAPMFFVVKILHAGSYLGAMRLASSFGLLKTVVFTQVVANVFIMALPFATNLVTGIGFFLIHHTFSHMDIPTRQAYVVAIVEPDEKITAAGFTNLVRPLSQAIGPIFTSYALSIASHSLPFLISGGLKLCYDLMLFFTFRNIKPPDEIVNV
jgi:MFS family permease